MSEEKEMYVIAYRRAWIVAGLDLILATFCAMNGSSMFVVFMVLAGLMWALGTYIKSKADNLQGE